MISMYQFMQVRSLLKEGLNYSQIARKLRINRSTVSKYANSNTPPKYKPREKSTRADPFKEFEVQVRTWVDLCPELKAVDIYEKIVESGYKGSERTVYRR